MRALILPGVPTPTCVTPFCSSFTCSSIYTNVRIKNEFSAQALCSSSETNSTLMCLAKSLIVFAAPLKVVSCLRGHRAEESAIGVSMYLRCPPTLAVFHPLDEFDGSEGRAADDQENHRALFRVILLDFCPFGAN